jgi:lactoylglutathione lyase
VEPIDELVRRLEAHPAVRAVRLVGSRAEGRQTAWSDWDFALETGDVAAVAADLPGLCASLDPVAQQWDPLSPQWCWTVLLPGPVKVDLVVGDEPHELAPPWTPSAGTLGAIDDHFWDWVFWLAGKAAAGRSELVSDELAKLHRFLLAPLGVELPPAAIGEAVSAYRAARAAAEERFGIRVSRRLERAVAPALREYHPGMASYLHTMVRITDFDRSRAFYEALGMEFRRELPIVRDGELEATNYFLGFPGDEPELELTLNHDGRTYELGTAYGHVAIAVDDLDETLAGLKRQGIEPEREPYRVREGGSRLCFVRDPDGYRLELIEKPGAGTTG